MTSDTLAPTSINAMKLPARPLLLIGAIAAACVIAFRLLNSVAWGLNIDPPASGLPLVILEGTHTLGAMLCGMTGTLLAVGLIGYLVARAQPHWRRIGFGIAAVLAIAWVGMEALASHFQTDQSPMRWPWWASYIADAAGTVALLTGLALVVLLMVSRRP